MAADSSKKRRQWSFSPRWKGRVLVAIAAIMWSTSGFFAKAPMLERWDGPEMAFWRAIFASVVLIPMVRQPKWSPWLIPMVASFALMNFTFLTALKQLEAACAIWLQFTAPIWVFLASAFVLRERVVSKDWLLFGFGTIGVFIILLFELSASHEPWGVTNGALSGLTFAMVVLSIRRLRSLDSAFLIALNHVATAVVLFPLLDSPFQFPSGSEWAMFAGFGILQMGLPYVIFARGLRTIPGHEASGIGLLEPILVPVWVFVAWSSSPSYTPPQWWTLVGGGLILIGLTCRYLNVRKEGRASSDS